MTNKKDYTKSETDIQTSLCEPIDGGNNIFVVTSNRYEAILPKDFNKISLVGLGFSILSTWIGLSSGIGVSLIEGGPAFLIYGLLIGASAILIITLGMAELASSYVTAAGQYHWVYIVSRRDMAPFAAFFTGWINVFGWWMAVSSLVLFCSSCITALAKLWHPEYAIQRWQSYLCYVSITLFITFYNCCLPKLLPKTNEFSLYLSITSFLICLIILLSMSAPDYNSAKFVFADTENLSGWSNSGIAYLLAIGNAMYPFIGTDAPAHLSEELYDPERNVPIAMLWSLAIGVGTGLPFSIALMFVIKDKLSVVNTENGLPFLEIVYQATDSKAATTGVILLVLICFVLTSNCALTTGSRLVFAFARDDGLPFSRIFSRISKNEAPVPAILLCCIFVSVWGCIYIGSETAFNSFISAAVTFQGYAYVIPQGILAWRGRDTILPKNRYFRLGKIGLAVNIIACGWMIFISVVFCFPPEMPVEVATMNYISVPLIGVPSIICIYWYIHKRKVFNGPDVGMFLETNNK